jgi:Tfp pilus assembly protein PilP
MNLRDIQRLALLTCFVGLTAGNTHAQEPIPTPSEKMKEAVGKLNKAPATIGQSLQGLRDAAAAKLKQTFGAGAKPDAKAAAEGFDVPQKTSEMPAAPHALKEGSRDPFRSPLMPKKVTTRVRENLSPLEQKDLSQLNLVGIISNIKEPIALIEDSTGLGYTVKVGTPIGINNGKVKAIHRDLIIVEENCENAYGVRKLCEIPKKLPPEQ